MVNGSLPTLAQSIKFYACLSTLSAYLFLSSKLDLNSLLTVRVERHTLLQGFSNFLFVTAKLIIETFK